MPAPEAPPLDTSFRAFVSRVKPRFQWYRHCQVIARELQDVADRKVLRLIVMLPPRHSKSEEVSRLFPAYFLDRRPDEFVGLASYAADLAHGLSKQARDFYMQAGHTLATATSAAREWHTGLGGGLWATGVGGPATGKGAHLLLIDDPFKNRKEADSEAIRRSIQEWYQSTWLTREEPGGAQVIVMTRWHEDDLVGWILDEELNGDQPENWRILSLPAIAERGDERPTYPPTCTVVDDWRDPGEALCPERYPIEKLVRRRARLGPYNWNSLYQQRPRPPEGKLCKAEWLSQFCDRDAVPKDATRVRWWDLAATEDGGAHTSGPLLAMKGDDLWIEDVVRGQWSEGTRDARIKQTAEDDRQRYGPGGVATWSAQDPGQAGKTAAAAFIRLLKGHDAHTRIESGDKVARARPFLSWAEAGHVKICRDKKWNKPYIETMIEFPGKVNDDMDATANAFDLLSGGLPPADVF